MYYNTETNTENIIIIRSGRKTLSVEIQPDLRVVVRAPKKMRESVIRDFINEKSAWIEKHIELMHNRIKDKSQTEAVKKLSSEEIESLKAKARQVITKRVEYYAVIENITYGRITIRSQKSRWGSCSSLGNLSFNCLLMLCPQDVIDYVVVHELCHIKELNHSRCFWNEVERILPDYNKSKKWLRDNGGVLIERIKQ